MAIFYDKSDFNGMKKAGALAFELLEMVAQAITPGMSTQDINDLVHDRTIQAGAKSAPLGYKGFPKSCCTSINQVVCHGIPSSDEILTTGDIINVDVTPIVNGYYGDTSRTFLVGGEKAVSSQALKVVQCAQKALNAGIEAVRTHKPCYVSHIAQAVTQTAQEYGFSVVYEFVGHGIGKVFHESPNIQHCHFIARKQPAIKIKPGMTFTIEPMINVGAASTRILSDGWTAVTTDGSLSAQFEHTLAMLPDGTVDILTIP